MTQAKAPTAFSEWLSDELQARGWGIRTLARKANPGNPEQARRALNRYIHQGMKPTDENRRMIARGFGISESDLPDFEEVGVSVGSFEDMFEALVRRVIEKDRKKEPV